MKNRKRGKMSYEIRERINNRIKLAKIFPLSAKLQINIIEKEFFVDLLLIWFGWVLCHLNSRGLFNAKSSLRTHTHTHTYICICIYIKCS